MPNNGSSNVFIDTTNNLVGFDLFQTAFNFVTNFGDPYDFTTNEVKPLGLYYLARHIPSPFTKCLRGIDDRAAVGLGIGWALIIMAIAVFGGLIVLTFIWSPLGAFYNGILGLLGIIGLISITFSIAWSYNIVCLDNTSGSALILSDIFGQLMKIPTLPEYAPTDIVNTVDIVLNASCGFIPGAYTLLNQPTTSTTCTLCKPDGSIDSSKKFRNCDSLRPSSLNGIFNLFQQELFTIYPPIIKFINQTCLVRGGCLILNQAKNINSRASDIKNDGFLNFLILDHNTELLLTTNTNTTNGQQLKICRDILWPSRIAIWLFLFLILKFIIKILIKIILVFILWGQKVLFKYSKLWGIILCCRKTPIMNL